MNPVYGTDYVIRPWNPEEDRAFILKTWSRCAGRSKVREHTAASADEFSRGHWAALVALLDRAELAVILHKDAPDHILGWVAWSPPAPGKPPVLHFVFVREAYRQQGVASALLEATIGLQWKAAQVIYTHKLSRLARSAEGTYPPIPTGWVYSIYPFFGF